VARSVDRFKTTSVESFRRHLKTCIFQRPFCCWHCNGPCSLQ